jgi:phosphinothricin acetyltransferase
MWHRRSRPRRSRSPNFACGLAPARSIIARVTGQNEASLALHERHGFVRVGLERQVALKHGIWLDVVTLQRILID